MEPYDPQIEKLNEEVRNLLISINDLTDDKKNKINEEVIRNISYYNNLTDKIEDRRSKLQTFSYQYLAILMTIFGLLLTFKNDLPDLEFFTIRLFMIIQIVSTLVMIIWYEIQSGYRYPFLKIDNFSNQWKWFYYGNANIQKIGRCPISNKKSEKKSQLFYLKGLKSFISNYKEETLDVELKNNILQVYLLQVHNYYKNRFYLQLLTIRKHGLYFTIGILIIYLWLKLLLLIS